MNLKIVKGLCAFLAGLGIAGILFAFLGNRESPEGAVISSILLLAGLAGFYVTRIKQ